MPSKIWMFLLAVWLLLTGLLVITNIAFPGLNIIMGIMAIITAILIFIDR